MTFFKSFRIATLCASGFLCLSCTLPELVDRPIGEETHNHFYAQSRSLGEKHYHATMEFEPRGGILAIVFLDKNEYPVKLLREEGIKASLRFPDGDVKEFQLHHPKQTGYRFSSYRMAGHRRPPTEYYILQSDWLKNLSSFNLTVWIPMRGTHYAVEYIYP